MNTIFELGGDLVAPSSAHNLMRLIAEGVGDEVSDHQFRVLAVNTYVKLLEKYSSLHELFIQVIASGRYRSTGSDDSSKV